MKVSYRVRSGNDTQGSPVDDCGINDESSAEESLAILGHEIRNPLGALNYALQAWPSTVDDSPLKQDLLQIMRQQVFQLTRLCNDLLDTGKIARGDFSVRHDSIDLRQVLKNACEEIRPLVEQRGHTLNVAFGDVPLELLGDETKLTQVFANILHNSAKFTHLNGRIDIDVERIGGKAVVRLRDNGRGMAAETIRELFVGKRSVLIRPGATVDGLGIGIRLAKKIIGLHGGEIAAISEGLGCGSTFEINLPLKEKDVSGEKGDSNAQEAVDFESSRNISRVPRYQVVVVDDDRSMGFLISRLLDKLGQSVTLVGDAAMAFRKILEVRPHVVFLDLHLHGISGYDVARQIRSCVELDSVVLIALTGATDELSRKLAAESGIDQYLVKPASLDELAKAIGRAGELSIC
jgi:CheY-like chemotaxis protein